MFYVFLLELVAIFVLLSWFMLVIFRKLLRSPNTRCPCWQDNKAPEQPVHQHTVIGNKACRLGCSAALKLETHTESDNDVTRASGEGPTS